MAGYIPKGETNRLGCGIGLIWLPLSFPFFVFMMLGGGGCEGNPQPCEPNNWPDFAFVLIVLLLGLGTAWCVKQLRFGARGAARWTAALLALLLVGFGAFVVWLLLQM